MRTCGTGAPGAAAREAGCFRGRLRPPPRLLLRFGRPPRLLLFGRHPFNAGAGGRPPGRAVGGSGELGGGFEGGDAGLIWKERNDETRTVLRSHSQGRAHRAPSSMESPLSHYRARSETQRNGAAGRRFRRSGFSLFGPAAPPQGTEAQGRFFSPWFLSLRQSADLQYSLSLSLSIDAHAQDDPSATGGRCV